jgi:hypothetical protein
MGRITNAIGMGMAIYNEYRRSKLAPPRLVPPYQAIPQPQPVRQAQQQQVANFSSKPLQLQIVNTELAALRAAKKLPPAQLKAAPSKSFSR